jgi:hypothetical protein
MIAVSLDDLSGGGSWSDSGIGLWSYEKQEIHGQAGSCRGGYDVGKRRAKVVDYRNIRELVTGISRMGYNSALCGVYAAEADEDRWRGV